MTAHTGIWANRRVTQAVRAKFDELAALAPQPRRPDVVAPRGAESGRFQRLADALVTLNETECQRRMADPAYGGSSYKIEYSHTPTAMQKDGVWYIVAGWCLMEKRPDRDSYFCTFQRGDPGAPQWISTGEVEAWVRGAGIKWE